MTSTRRPVLILPRFGNSLGRITFLRIMSLSCSSTLPMYIDIVPNRNSPPAVLLRESSRVGKKIIKRTLANLSDWPAPQVDLLRRVLKGEALLSPSQTLQIERSLPHGHVAAALGTLRRIGLESELSR